MEIQELITIFKLLLVIYSEESNYKNFKAVEENGLISGLCKASKWQSKYLDDSFVEHYKRYLTHGNGSFLLPTYYQIINSAIPLNHKKKSSSHYHS